MFAVVPRVVHTFIFYLFFIAKEVDSWRADTIPLQFAHCSQRYCRVREILVACTQQGMCMSTTAAASASEAGSIELASGPNEACAVGVVGLISSQPYSARTYGGMYLCLPAIKEWISRQVSV